MQSATYKISIYKDVIVVRIHGAPPKMYGNSLGFDINNFIKRDTIMPTYTKKSIMDVLNYRNTDYTPRQQETKAQIDIWVSEGKTDGVVQIETIGTSDDTITIKYTRVWTDQAAAQAYGDFGNIIAPKYDDEILSFEILDNV